MKKLTILAVTAIALSGCSWFKQSSQWADNNFFGGDPSAPQNPSNNYPYYYSSAMPIDANEGQAYSSPYPPAAPGAIANPQQSANTAFAPSIPAGQQAVPTAPNPGVDRAQSQAAAGGYGVRSDAPSVNVTYGSKGTDVSAAKTGEAIKNPQPVLPALQGTQGQQYYPQGYVQPQPPVQQYQQYQQAPVVQPQSQVPIIAPAYGYTQPNPAYPAQAPQVQPQPVPYGQAPAQAPQQGYAQPLTPEQQQQMYQNLYYGQQYAPQNYTGQYQYPPAK